MASHKAKELLARLADQRENIAAIQQLWEFNFPGFGKLDARQISVWVRMYDFDVVVEGLDIALQRHNKKLQDGQAWGRDDAIKYASGCMKRLKAGGD